MQIFVCKKKEEYLLSVFIHFEKYANNIQSEEKNK